MKRNEIMLNEAENKMGCALFTAVYRDELSLNEIVSSVIDRYNEEENETRKEMFIESISNLCYWSIDKPSIAELHKVLVNLHNCLQLM